MPKLSRSTDQIENSEMRNWDLWGPLLFTLLLCM